MKCNYYASFKLKGWSAILITLEKLVNILLHKTAGWLKSD